MCLLGRTLVTVPLVQEEHDEQKHENCGDIERRKKGVGIRLIEHRFDPNLARDVNDWWGRCWWSGVHLIEKTCFFHGKVAHRRDFQSFRPSPSWSQSTNSFRSPSRVKLVTNLENNSYGQNTGVDSVQMTGPWWNMTDNCLLEDHGSPTRMVCRRVSHVDFRTRCLCLTSQNGTAGQTTKEVTRPESVLP